MPRPQSKRDLILKSSFEGPTDVSEALADGVLLRGNAGDQRLAAGSDAGWWIEGRGGADRIEGAGGDDLLIAGRAVLGHAGTDGDPDVDDALGVSTNGTGGACTIQGGGGNDLVVGGLGHDVLDGGDGNDSLWGLEGDEVLLGGAGDDLMHAGTGKATVDGGAGFDTFSFAELDYEFGRGKLAAAVLNLSDRTIRYESGDQLGEARILVEDASGGFRFLGEADTVATRATLRPEGEVTLDLAADSADSALGKALNRRVELKFPSLTERVEGTLGKDDVIVLGASFTDQGLTPDGWNRWSDGTVTVEFREFEVILIA